MDNRADNANPASLMRVKKKKEKREMRFNESLVRILMIRALRDRIARGSERKARREEGDRISRELADYSLKKFCITAR